MANKRFIVTGGSGYVGQFLIRKLAKLYPEIQIHNLDINQPSKIESSNLSFHKVDLRKKESVESFAFSEDDIVFHLAAYIITPETPSKKGARLAWYESLNVHGTQNLIDAMKKKGAKDIAFLSSDMVYGLPQMTPIKVNHPLSPNGPYGVSKLKAEKIITNFGQQKDCRSIIFRPRLIIGPDRLGILGKLFFLVKNNLPVPLIGSGNNVYQFISVHDCVDALIEFYKQEKSSGIYNLGSVNPPKVKDLMRSLVKEANSNSLVIPTWGKGVKAILHILDAINLTLIYPEQFELADQNNILDITELKDGLKIVPKYDDKDMLFDAYKSYYQSIDS